MSGPLVRRWSKAIAASELRAPVRLVALTLALHMNGKGGSCFPSLTTLESETGLSRRHIPDYLRDLEAAGFVACDRRPGRVTRYRALLPELGTDGPYSNEPDRGPYVPGVGTEGPRTRDRGSPEDAKRTRTRTKTSGRAGARENYSAEEEARDRAYTRS